MRNLSSLNTAEGVILNFEEGTLNKADYPEIIVIIATDDDGLPDFNPHKTQSGVEIVKVYSGPFFGLLRHDNFNAMVEDGKVFTLEGTIYATVRQQQATTRMPRGVKPYVAPYVSTKEEV